MYSIEGHEFEHVARITPRRDLNGELIEVWPQSRYSNPRRLELHQYGGGPFCAFSIAPGWEGKSGVYVFLTDGVSKYVGECEDLEMRMNLGYGNISPRNCFRGGQQTNCRINSLILEAGRRGAEIRLLFCESDDRHRLEANLIQKLNPSWNKGQGFKHVFRGERLRGDSAIVETSRLVRPATSCRDEVVAAARALTAGRAGATFTVQDIVDYLRRSGSAYAEATIRTHVTSRCCVNAPDHRAVTYDDIERVDRGQYRLVR
jgi:hypothetical protein